MMLVSMTVTLCISVLLLRLHFANAVECPGVTIKHFPDPLLALKNCTSILGSLVFGNMWDVMTNETDYQLPNLIEITGFLVISNIKGLRSAGNLFPKLTVIRGGELVMSFALLLFNNTDMETLGLTSLMSIERGYVLIESCPELCFYDTIDWEAITDEEEDEMMASKGNVIQQQLKKSCPTTKSCRGCDPLNCWSSSECQKKRESVYNVIPIDGLDCNKACRGQCVNETLEGCVKGVKCHESCQFGCVDTTDEGCIVCSKLKWRGKCVDKCPSELYEYPDTKRCITNLTCIRRYNSIPFNGECRQQCPAEYSQYHPITNEFHDYQCFKCEIKCPQRCLGLEIHGPTELEYFRECAIVNGSLSIRLGVNMSDIYDKLHENLGNIETINGALKIYRSFGLTSLSFFRSLNTIDARNATFRTKGRDENQTEYQNPYALEIIENENLQKLFNLERLEIIGGGMLFHMNPKLCLKEIHNLQTITIYDSENDKVNNETNGYDEVCHSIGIYAIDEVQSHDIVQIYWNITDFGADKTLNGYFVYYIEAPSHNITHHYGLDACSTKKLRNSPSKYSDLPMISKHRNSDVWQSVFVPFEDLQQEGRHFRTNLTGLKQHTQYAYYVRTQLSLKHRDEMINVLQGQSNVKYFKTLPDRPRPPIVRTRHKSNETITLEWMPSTPEPQLVQRYIIDVYELADELKEIETRNYCNDPKVVKKRNATTVPEVICCRDQRAYLEFFQRDTNQSCGHADPTCEKAFEFILFHHDVENTLRMADQLKPPSERYQHKVMPYDDYALDPIHRSNSKYLFSHIIDDNRTDSVFVPTLKPFNLYAFYVYACNTVTNCSDYYFHSERTAPSPDSDAISVTALPDKVRTDIITISIRPPNKTNSIIVAYEVESYDYALIMPNITCIPKKVMEEMNYSIRFENLSPGSHAFRARYLSIGYDGEFNDWVWVDVDDLSDNKYKWGIALAFICIIVIVIVTIICKKVKAYRNPRIGDIDFLLPDRRDSDDDLITAERKPTHGLPVDKQNVPSAWPSSQSLVPSDGIPMSLFKSNESKSNPLDQPSTSNPGPTKDTKLNVSPLQRILKNVQTTPPKSDDTEELLSESESEPEPEPENADSSWNDDDYDYSLFDN